MGSVGPVVRNPEELPHWWWGEGTAAQLHGNVPI